MKREKVLTATGKAILASLSSGGTQTLHPVLMLKRFIEAPPRGTSRGEDLQMISLFLQS